MPVSRNVTLRRWILRSLAVLAFLVLLAAAGLWFWGGPYAQRIIHAKLQEMVSDHLDATLEMGDVEYTYPYGVTVNEVALVTERDGERITLASFEQLRLQLTRLPYDDGPLQIQRIEIDSPTIRVIRTPEGFIGETGLVRPDDERARRQAPKLSDIFHLRHVKIAAAQIVYEDRRVPGETPLAWRDVNVTLDSQPDGVAHAFDFNGNSGKVATIDGKGKVDLDTLTVDLESLLIQTRIDPDQSESPLPPQVTQLLRRYQVAGTATVDISGRIPAFRYHEGNAKVTLKVENATAVHPDFPDPLQDLDLTVSASYAEGDLNTTMEFFAARSGSMGISASRFNVLMDLDTRKWTASPVRFAIAYAPTDITKSIFGQPATLFVVARATQMGDLADIAVDLTGSSLSLQNLNDELQLAGSFEIHPESIILNPTTVTGLGGSTYFDGWCHLPTRLSSANVKLDRLSLGSLLVLINPTQDRQMKGRLSANVAAQITGTDLASLAGSGNARIDEGALPPGPIIAGISTLLSIGRGDSVVQSGYARFGIENKSVKFERLGASTNALRARGTGTITFDQQLDLRIYVVTNGDWGKGVKNTGIPVISDVGGLLAGGAQKVVTGVTSQFTTVRVRGNIDSPKITPDPAPAITDQVKKLFESE